MRKIDQVILSILVNNLYWTAEEMNIYLVKAAFSTNIKVRRDCSCALYTRNGELLAQGEFIPVHLGVMAQTLKEILKIHPVETLREGDMIIHNDPYMMGSHLWDVMLFKPIYYNGKLIAFAGSLAHQVDIGGASVNMGQTTIFEEGLRLPPVKLYREGVLQEDVMQIIQNNCRTPYEVRGDLAAQTAANYRGEKRIHELAEKYGEDFLIEYFEAILDYSERGMRAAIAGINDGKASFEDIVEHNGLEPCEIPICVQLEIRGDEIYASFDGTGEPGAGSVNAPWALTHSAIYYAVKSVIGSKIPTNAGAYRPIHLIRPKQPSIADTPFPHAVALCTNNPAQRIVDAAIGAFAKIVPEKAAACDGHWADGRFVGMDPRTGRFSAYVETYACGRGAKHDEDGADAHQTHLTNTANAPIEIIELEHPFKVERYGLIPDSCGAGEFRGGVGITRELKVLADMSGSVAHKRLTSAPYGLFGGMSGSHDYCQIEMQNGEKCAYSTKVHAGDRVIVRTSGGGGWGDPLKRDLDRIARDLLDGYITPEYARRYHKVEIDPETGRIDREKTEALRKRG